MIKKDYQKPTMMVVKLKQRTHLLQASGGPKTLSGRNTSGSGTQDNDWYDLE